MKPAMVAQNSPVDRN